MGLLEVFTVIGPAWLAQSLAPYGGFNRRLEHAGVTRKYLDPPAVEPHSVRGATEEKLAAVNLFLYLYWSGQELYGGRMPQIPNLWVVNPVPLSTRHGQSP